jgi:hypothetical protein
MNKNQGYRTESCDTKTLGGRGGEYPILEYALIPRHRQSGIVYGRLSANPG